jgi:beta-hydroxyacyl-ACP dehydratase FabZ
MTTDGVGAMNIVEIMRYLPHRYPFLLVDRVFECDGKTLIRGMKNVTMNEPFFQGHFPGIPVFPGVLVIEALAQAGAVLLLHDMPERDSKLVYFTGIDAARFRRIVRPGDQLQLSMQVTQLRPRACRMKGVAEVDGQVAAEAEIFSTMGDRE